MPRQTTSGADGYKRIYTRTFIDGKSWSKDFRAEAKKLYVQSDIEGLIGRCIAYLEKQFPTHEFNIVRLQPNVINFIGTKFDTAEEIEEIRSSRPGLDASRGEARIFSGGTPQEDAAREL